MLPKRNAPSNIRSLVVAARQHISIRQRSATSQLSASSQRAATARKRTRYDKPSEAPSTAGIDITTEDTSVSELRSVLEKAGYVLRPDIEELEELIEHHRILPLVHAKTGMQLDVVRAGPGPEEGMLERVVLRRVGKKQIPFVSTNDLLVLKTLAGREKDLGDIRALLSAATAEIDLARVRKRLDELGRLIDDSTLRRSFDEQVRQAVSPPRKRGKS